MYQGCRQADKAVRTAAAGVCVRCVVTAILKRMQLHRRCRHGARVARVYAGVWCVYLYPDPSGCGVIQHWVQALASEHAGKGDGRRDTANGCVPPDGHPILQLPHLRQPDWAADADRRGRRRGQAAAVHALRVTRAVRRRPAQHGVPQLPEDHAPGTHPRVLRVIEICGHVCKELGSSA